MWITGMPVRWSDRQIGACGWFYIYDARLYRFYAGLDLGVFTVSPYLPICACIHLYPNSIPWNRLSLSTADNHLSGRRALDVRRRLLLSRSSLYV
jgi:hypothetical protein